MASSPSFQYGFMRKKLLKVKLPVIAFRGTSMPATVRGTRRKKRINFNSSDIFSQTQVASTRLTTPNTKISFYNNYKSYFKVNRNMSIRRKTDNMHTKYFKALEHKRQMP